MMPVQKPGRSKQDYGTPWELIRAVEARWGKLTIDLAANEDGSNAKAPRWLWDAFNCNWSNQIDIGIGWLNPPFADIEPWVKKASEETARIIMLVPASIGSNWFAEYVHSYAHVVGLRPRLAFQGCHVLDKHGVPKCGGDSTCDGCQGYPKDCMLLLYGFHSDATLSHHQLSIWKWK
jgi:phage N-6-adenine-methyltransferase